MDQHSDLVHDSFPDESTSHFRATPFSAQGDTGGPVNIPGRLASGKPATFRSESTEHELARRADPGASSMLQQLISPQQAAFRDAIHNTEQKRKNAAGDY